MSVLNSGDTRVRTGGRTLAGFYFGKKNCGSFFPKKNPSFTRRSYAGSGSRGKKKSVPSGISRWYAFLF
ncbi:MAG: hypothetical protein D6714_20155 [Bacteroidetes bacterium]|nr:MAG: hypothetical protein D6714_20155 [Bacteroidota bacterium]